MNAYCECGSRLSREDVFDGLTHCYTCRASFSLESTLPFESEYYDREDTYSRREILQLDEPRNFIDRSSMKDYELEDAIEYNNRWELMEQLEHEEGLTEESIRYLDHLEYELISRPTNRTIETILSEDEENLLLEISREENSEDKINELVEKVSKNAQEIGLPMADEIE